MDLAFCVVPQYRIFDPPDIRAIDSYSFRNDQIHMNKLITAYSQLNLVLFI